MPILGDEFGRKVVALTCVVVASVVGLLSAAVVDDYTVFVVGRFVAGVAQQVGDVTVDGDVIVDGDVTVDDDVTVDCDVTGVTLQVVDVTVDGDVTIGYNVTGVSQQFVDVTVDWDVFYDLYILKIFPQFFFCCPISNWVFGARSSFIIILYYIIRKTYYLWRSIYYGVACATWFVWRRKHNVVPVYIMTWYTCLGTYDESSTTQYVWRRTCDEVSTPSLCRAQYVRLRLPQLVWRLAQYDVARISYDVVRTSYDVVRSMHDISRNSNYIVRTSYDVVCTKAIGNVMNSE